MSDDSDDLSAVAAIALGEAQQAIEHQANALVELRSRAGLLLAASAIATSFLGSEALNQDDGLECLGILAMVAFGISFLASLYILWPRSRAWIFELSAKTILEDWGGKDSATIQASLAEWKDAHHDQNDLLMERLFWWFQVASIALAASVLLWIVQLATI